MSSTASNYDLPSLTIGIILCVLAAVASFMTSFPALLESKITGAVASFTLILHGVMMFASSYIEEEHHFWYWVSSAWLMWLLCKQ